MRIARGRRGLVLLTAMWMVVAACSPATEESDAAGEVSAEVTEAVTGLDENPSMEETAVAVDTREAAGQPQTLLVSGDSEVSLGVETNPSAVPANDETTTTDAPPDSPTESDLGASSGPESDLPTGSGPTTSTVSDPDTPISPKPGTPAESEPRAGSASGSPDLQAVFFAQTHVLQPSDPYFGLTGGREVLVKAHVVDPDQGPAPEVVAIVETSGKSLSIALTGPGRLPTSAPSRPGVVRHSFDDSYTGVIPADWVKPGMVVTVQAGGSQKRFDELKVGAPTRVIMTMFDLHFFTKTDGGYPKGWEQELENNWPVADLEVRRAPAAVFPEVVRAPNAGRGWVPKLITKKEDFIDNEQATVASWNSALKAAAGHAGRWSLYYSNFFGLPGGGQAGGFSGIGNGRRVGLLNHELGHALGLPHWGRNKDYPYRGPVLNTAAPNSEVHVGPTWAYDQRGRRFLPPVVGSTAVGGQMDRYKKDPMQGGGAGDQEQGYLLRPFSDYSVHRMRGFLERHAVAWSDQLNNLASWKREDNAYTGEVNANGVSFPVVRDTQVYSVMATSSEAGDDAHLVYPPIGPYTSGLIDLFDPQDPEQRKRAAEIYCPTDGGCDVSLRVTQGGMTKTYLLPIAWQQGVKPTSWKAYGVGAINLPVGDGTITKVELLKTPDAHLNGLPANPTVLDQWR